MKAEHSMLDGMPMSVYADFLLRVSSDQETSLLGKKVSKSMEP